LENFSSRRSEMLDIMFSFNVVILGSDHVGVLSQQAFIVVFWGFFDFDGERTGENIDRQN
jgi:hypothetical protein